MARGRVAGDVTRDFALHDFAGRRIGETASLEEERYIPNVMESERNERALDPAVDGKGHDRPAVHRPVRKGFDAVANRRPDKAQHDADEDDRKRCDNGDRALARKKAKIRRELDLVEAVEGPRRDQADDDAAEDAGLDRRNAHDRNRLDAAELRAHAHRGEKNYVTSGARQCGDAIIVRESDGDADGKEERQIAEDRVAGILHYERNAVRQPREFGGPDAQQNARDGQDGNRQHHAFPDFLEKGEGVLE